MDKAALIHQRRKRYMAKILDHFDREVAEHLPDDVAERMKDVIRLNLTHLSLDAIQVSSLRAGESLNLAAFELRDQVNGNHRRLPTKRSTPA